MKTIKIIDLLNKIANGEELPTKIRYANHIWILVNRTYFDEGTNMFEDYLANAIIESLNDEVEIIEEDKEIEKLKLEYRKDSNKQLLKTDIGYLTMRKADVLMINKISELVDEVNKLKENNK